MRLFEIILGLVCHCLVGWFHLVMQVGSCRVDMSGTYFTSLTVERNTRAELFFNAVHCWVRRRWVSFTFWRCDRKNGERRACERELHFFPGEVTQKNRERGREPCERAIHFFWRSDKWERAYAWDKEMFFIGERTTCACMMMWLWERNVAGGERDMHGLRPVHVLPLLICCDYSPLTAKPRTQHESLKNWAHQIRGCLGTRVLWHLFDRLYFFVASHYRLYFFVAVIWCACIYIVLIHNGL